jgi:hypothetical protein
MANGFCQVRDNRLLQLGCTYRLYLPKRYHRLQFFGMQIVGRVTAREMARLTPPYASGDFMGRT